MDIKKLAINHAEKAVFAVAALFGLYALWQADWTPYRGSAEEITDKIDSGRNNLKNTQWPAEEKEKFRVTNDQAPANVLHQRLLTKRDPSSLAMPGEMTVDFFNENNPVTEPVLLTVRNPTTTSGRVFLDRTSEAAPPPAETPSAPGTPLAAQTVDDSIPDEFRGPGAVVQGGPGGLAQNGGAGSEADQRAEESRHDYDERMAMQEIMLQQMLANGGSDDPQLLSNRFDQANLVRGPVLNGKGYSFVAVRATFPLHEQIEKYQAAIHRPYHTAANVFEIYDFELQRQMQLPGKDQWTEWAPVDLEIARDILEKANGFQMDVVDSTITNSVITMPLPARITGEWRELATHPDIKNFELSEAEMDQEYKLQKVTLLEAARRSKTVQPVARPRRGFFDVNSGTPDPRQTLAQLTNTPSGYGIQSSTPTAPEFDALIKELAKYEGNGEDKKQEEAIRQWMKKQFDARGELLLFRYFDFGVQPGHTYRYRVRLILTNPNFGKSLQAAGGLQQVVEGETRETPWGAVTAPVFVEAETQYYVRSTNESGTRIFPTSRFDVFEWNTDKGTTINASLDVSPGQYIAGTQKVNIVDAAQSRYEQGVNHEIKSQDFVVDIAPSITFDKPFHAEGADDTGVKISTVLNSQLPVPAQTLVHTAAGDLKYYSPPYQYAEYERRKQLLSLEEKMFAHLRNTASSNASSLLEDPPAEDTELRGSRRKIRGLGTTSRGSTRANSRGGAGARGGNR